MLTRQCQHQMLCFTMPLIYSCPCSVNCVRRNTSRSDQTERGFLLTPLRAASAALTTYSHFPSARFSHCEETLPIATSRNRGGCLLTLPAVARELAPGRYLGPLEGLSPNAASNVQEREPTAMLRNIGRGRFPAVPAMCSPQQCLRTLVGGVVS